MMASRYLSLVSWRPLLFPVTGNTGTITTPAIVAKTTDGGVLLYALDAHRHVFLAALFLERLQCQDLDQGRVTTIRTWWSAATTNWVVTHG